MIIAIGLLLYLLYELSFIVGTHTEHTQTYMQENMHRV